MAKDFNAVAVVDHYDSHIRQLIPAYEWIHKQVAALLHSYLDTHAEIVIVGCGTGHELQMLAEYAPDWRFFAIDPAPNMIEKAQQRMSDAGLAHRVEFCVADSSLLTQTAYSDKFDAALSILVSHFVPLAQKSAYFEAIFQSLKIGGLCLSYDLTTCNEPKQRQALKQLANLSGLHEKQSQAMLTRMDDDFALISAEQLHDLLMQVGFQSVNRFSQILAYHGFMACKS